MKAEVPMRQSGTVPGWSLAQRIALRFFFLYFVLFFLEDRAHGKIPVPGFLATWYSDLWYVVLAWFGENVVGTGYDLDPGSGISNTLHGWLLCLCFLTVAAVGTVIWSVLDRRRVDLERLHQGLRLLLRVSLAASMIFYGLLKLIPSQMTAPPPLGVLLFHVGDLAPYHLLWWTVGSSPTYESILGFAELLAGLLLLWPRTTLLGALLSAAEMLMVFALNMSYDVSVKLYSFHFVVMAVLLTAPDLSRLANLFLWNRRVEPAREPSLFANPRLQRAANALFLLFGLYVAGVSTHNSWERYQRAHPPRPPLYGNWDVEEFVVEGKAVPLFRNPDRWRRVLIMRPGTLGVELMTGSYLSFKLDLDPAKGTMRLGPDPPVEFSWTQPEADVLLLEGRLDGRRTQMKLRKMALLRKSFHWVSPPSPAR